MEIAIPHSIVHNWDKLDLVTNYIFTTAEVICEQEGHIYHIATGLGNIYIL